ncbi:hypothetical protein PG993_013266 [Apiospora rasikravindrae]|uniref:Uncharacterized protein n=1 Tax=Apiospora rasikravindrae TaxID=990691 RepID=A0ABR1RX56_9PEZI
MSFIVNNDIIAQESSTAAKGVRLVARQDVEKGRRVLCSSAVYSNTPTSNNRPSGTRRETMKSVFSEMDQFTIARLENSYDSRPDPSGGANIGNQEVYVILDSLKEIIRLMKEEGLYGLVMSQLLEDYAPLHDETGNHEARRSQMTEALQIRQMCLGNFHLSTLELQRKIDRLQYLR